jgi:hypothetical protein
LCDFHPGLTRKIHKDIQFRARPPFRSLGVFPYHLACLMKVAS